jgi:hypothetical protein
MRADDSDSRSAFTVHVGKPAGKKDLEDLSVDSRTILKRILKK